MPKIILNVKQTNVTFGEKDDIVALNEFIHERFRGWAPSHQLSILSGSTTLYFSPKEIGQHAVCDAGSIKWLDAKDITSKSPLSINVAMADGLGYDDEDINFNLSLGAVAGKTAELFVEKNFLPVNKENVNHFLKEIAKTSKEFALTKPREKARYKSECSLAATGIKYIDEKWGGYCINIGDGMIIILSATYKVKYIVPARVSHISQGNYTPDSLQFLLKNDIDFIIKKIDLDEGDLIISMTDGVYAGLELITSSEKKENESEFPAFKEISIVSAAFEKLFNQLDTNQYYSTYEIASYLLQLSVSVHQKEFNQAYSLYSSLKEFIDKQSDNFESLTLDKFLDILQEKNANLFSMTKHYLQNSGKHDGTTFILHKAFVMDLMHILSTQEYGDCSTLSIIRVPYYQDELIKTLIEDPSQEHLLIEQLMKISLDEILISLNRIRQERIIPGKINSSGTQLGDEKLYYQYSDKQLYKIQKSMIRLHEDKGSLLHQLKSRLSPVPKIKSNIVVAHGEEVPYNERLEISTKSKKKKKRINK